MNTNVNQITISAQEDFLESLSSTSSLNALAELIWNGLDAESDQVEVRLVSNNISGLEEIHIKDHGTGIPHDEIQILFGNLGASWKKQKGRLNGRALHGKNGQGRFKAFALGSHVTWASTFRSGTEHYSYQISGRSSALDSLTFTDPVLVTDASTGTGTDVIICEIEKSHGALLSDDAPLELAKLFAAYLSQYPNVRIILNGTQIDPSALQEFKKELQLPPIELSGGKVVNASVSIVEWKMPTKRAIHLCDASGVSLHELEAGVHAPGFQFTAYVKCDHFRELDKTNSLILEDLNVDVKAIVSKSKDALRAHFRKRLAARQYQIVERWKDEHIYPYEEKSVLTPVEEAERQVFDILGVNLEAYLPNFDEADQSARKFTFRILAQALRDNPESVQKIITEVLNLKKEEQEDLAQLLSKTPLSAIISSANIVANRLDFLVALDNLLFDKETKKKLLERDQLHKILEKEAWIFDEDFSLAGTEQRLEEVLLKHIGILGEREDGSTAVVVGDDGTGRIDLMLSRTIQPRTGKYDYLIVELKRPSKKIDDEVITQVKKYAMAVAADERFNGIPATWTFIAVSNELTDFARNDASQPNRPQGQVYASPNGNITVWVREWADVINCARARLQFVNSRLSYEANRDSAKAYLQKTHAKFIPVEDAVDPDGSNDPAESESGTKPPVDDVGPSREG